MFAGVTGRQFEEEFGRAVVAWNGEYTPYRQSLRQVLGSQKPNAALCEQGEALRQETAKALGVDASQVTGYSAIGSCLDKKHGVDIVFSFQGLVVTVDVTLSRKERYKADVIVGQDDVRLGLWLAADRVRYAFKWAAQKSVGC
jgi:hypothetical protein